VDSIERLFLTTLRDLRFRVDTQDPYLILGSSALIRKLLLDDYPLPDQVNRKYRLKVSFEVTQPRVPPPGIPEPKLLSVQDGLDPDTAPPFRARQTVPRDQLLGYVLARIEGRAYTSFARSHASC
jgi:hypothetical protein